MEQAFMREKPVLPLVLSMSLPMILSMMVASLYNIIDSYFVAKISEDAMTALALVYPVQNLINAVTIGFSIGINAVIAYHLGAKKEREVNRAASWGLMLSTIHGILLTVLCIGVMPWFLRMFTSSASVLELGLRYARIAFGFAVIIAWGMAYEKIFQSLGMMFLTMISMLCGCIANIILDPLLIFGWGPFPQMGIEGAALATGLGQTISLLMYWAIILIRPIPVRIHVKYLRLDRELILRLYAIGIPATLNMALPSLLISSLNVILAAYSQAYVTVLGVYYKLQTFLYLPANGIVQGMRPLVGYNYGAEEWKRVEKIYQVALLLSAGIMAVGMVLCQAVPSWLIGLFATSQETIAAGTMALRIISAGFLVSAISVISSGALEGLGKGGPSLMISLLRYVFVMIPVAFVLSRMFGAVGVWHGFWVTETVTAVAAYGIYRRELNR